MKFVLLLSLLITSFINSDVSSALSNGDAVKLAQSFHTTVDLQIPDSEGVYSKAQAEQIIKKFFEKIKVTSYKKIHEGKKGDTNFVVGELLSKSHKYRTYYLVKGSGKNMRIHQLRIEQQ